MSHTQTVPTLDGLPHDLQRDGAININIEEGVPILRASQATQNRIEELLQKTGFLRSRPMSNKSCSNTKRWMIT